MVGSMPLKDNSLVIALLKALANEQRLLIVKMLMKGERNVGEIESCLTLTQSALSQHLARLRRDHIVQTRRHAQLIYYSLNKEKVASLIRYLDDL